MGTLIGTFTYITSYIDNNYENNDKNYTLFLMWGTVLSALHIYGDTL